MDKLDYKKAYKDLYLPKAVASAVTVPDMAFLAVKGEGAPASPEFQAAVGLLYAFTFSIKMSKMNGTPPQGYFEYVVPPLEGLWGSESLEFDSNDRNSWCWTLMIRQPEFVTQALFESAREILRKKSRNWMWTSRSFSTLKKALRRRSCTLGHTPQKKNPWRSCGLILRKTS